jgi:hypothetical protein
MVFYGFLGFKTAKNKFPQLPMYVTILPFTTQVIGDQRAHDQ